MYKTFLYVKTKLKITLKKTLKYVGRSHQGFPGNLRKKFFQIKNKFRFELVFLRGLRRKYFKVRPKSQHKKLANCPNCSWENKKWLYNIFRPLFCHSQTNWGPYVHQNSSAKRYFLRPLLGYFAECSTTWQQHKFCLDQWHPAYIWRQISMLQMSQNESVVPHKFCIFSSLLFLLLGNQI